MILGRWKLLSPERHLLLASHLPELLGTMDRRLSCHSGSELHSPQLPPYLLLFEGCEWTGNQQNLSVLPKRKKNTDQKPCCLFRNKCVYPFSAETPHCFHSQLTLTGGQSPVWQVWDCFASQGYVCSGKVSWGHWGCICEKLRWWQGMYPLPQEIMGSWKGGKCHNAEQQQHTSFFKHKVP